MEDGRTMFAPATSDETMEPAFIESLMFSARQKQRIVDIRSIWTRELQALQDERRLICAAIWVRTCSKDLCCLVIFISCSSIRQDSTLGD